MGRVKSGGGGGKRLGIVEGEENGWMWRRIKYGRGEKEVIVGVKRGG